MLELFIFGRQPEVKPSPLIQTVIEQRIEAPTAPSEPTLEEKIASNYYKCDETIQYIRADNAMCLDKPKYRPPTERFVAESTDTQLTTKTQARTPENGYEYASCTWGVKNWKPEVGNDWGNAKNWGYAAQADGWTVSDTPVVGAVAWTTRGAYGHVALVVGVSGDQVTVKEQNYDWKSSIRTITVPVSRYRYIY